MKNNLQKTIEWCVELGVEIAKDLEDKKLSFGNKHKIILLACQYLSQYTTM